MEKIVRTENFEGLNLFVFGKYQEILVASNKIVGVATDGG